MNVPCPRGQNCPGSTAFAVQKCFLSETAHRMPLSVRRQMRTEIESRWERMLVELGVTMADNDGATEYQVYQCAACGARVYFMKLQGKLSRLGDDL